MKKKKNMTMTASEKKTLMNRINKHYKKYREKKTFTRFSAANFMLFPLPLRTKGREKRGR